MSTTIQYRTAETRLGNYILEVNSLEQHENKCMYHRENHILGPCHHTVSVSRLIQEFPKVLDPSLCDNDVLKTI